MYHIVFLILLIIALIESFYKIDKKIIFIVFFLLLCFLTLRYGQGSDYFHYVYLIKALANDYEWALAHDVIWKIPNEIGFTYLSYFWIKLLHFSPEVLVAVMSGFSFLVIYKFIKKYSQRPIFSLFVFYCVFYLIYPFSAIRQSVCLSIFVYYMAPLLHEKKYFKYYILAALLYTIHYSSIILFILPAVNIFKSLKVHDVFILSVICLIIGIILIFYLKPLSIIFGSVGVKIGVYSGTRLDIFSLLLRITLFIPIIQTLNYYDEDSFGNLILRIYILGFLVYVLFFAFPLISSRLNVFMRYFEIILLIDYLIYITRRKFLVSFQYTFVFLVLSVIYFKNINSFIGQGPYKNNIKVYNYPYVSIFNKKKILEVRQFSDFYRQFVQSK
jgi:hypothetical protein